MTREKGETKRNIHVRNIHWSPSVCALTPTGIEPLPFEVQNNTATKGTTPARAQRFLKTIPD